MFLILLIIHDYGAQKMRLRFYKYEYFRPKWEIIFSIVTIIRTNHLLKFSYKKFNFM